MSTDDLIFFKSTYKLGEKISHDFSFISKITPLKRDEQWVQLRKLRELYVKKRLVLVLGSGVSNDFDLPDWHNLIRKMLIKSYKVSYEISKNKEEKIIDLLIDLFAPNNLILARNVSIRESTHYPYFIQKEVRDILYKEKNNIEITPLFKEIRQFCKDPSLNLNSIITFNYDDMLENCLKQSVPKIHFKPIYDDGMQPRIG
jgi:hypothetical protein